jgi:hypothetical protein
VVAAGFVIHRRDPDFGSETMMLASSEDIAMASIMVSMTVAVVWIIAHQWRKVRVAAYNARLKQLMIERGMSASEIERVLGAGEGSDSGKRAHRSVAIGLGGNCCGGDVREERART